jgi:FAD/FMN-containing dehydrogenase
VSGRHEATDSDARGLHETVVEEWRSAVVGNVLVPGDETYDDARAVWNAMIDRRPAVIVRCRGADDVIAGVVFAGKHQLPVAIRGGGHNVAGHAVCDDGVMIDLSEMRSVQVDPERRRARVAGGATWRDVDGETQAFGLAVPGGLISNTGVAGGRIYLNFPGLGEEGEELVRRSYGANFARLGEVKRKYDPLNVFRFNQNIKPG